jgi:hypothetical protein
MNVPVKADDNFISQMATLVHSQLGSTQKIYVEPSNELWNSSFSQFKDAVDRGRPLWPTRSSSRGDYEYNREWLGMRTAQMCDIWRSVWRSDPRLVCVLDAQAAWSFSATEALKTRIGFRALSEIYEGAKRIQRIVSNGKPAVDSSSCITVTSESRPSTAPGAPLSRSCKRPLRSAAPRLSGRPFKVLSRELRVGGRVVRARSVQGKQPQSQRFQRTGVVSDLGSLRPSMP